jgi:hypothetical protein
MTQYSLLDERGWKGFLDSKGGRDAKEADS